MSSRSFRRVLVGSLVTAFLILGGPVSGEAADLFESPDVSSFWARAWQWLTEQISQAEQERAAFTAASGAAEAPAERDGSDAAWTLDPNG